MTEIWAQAALWLGLALIASLLSIWLRMATALSEIVVGTIAQLIIGALLGRSLLAGDATWIKFLSGAGAILLTFLAGAELDPTVFRRQWKQATAIGLVSFIGPFLGCAALARWGLGWSVEASWLAGIAMSTTSVAVVYAVMLEFGLNVTDYGKTVLAACFITDLATVVALGLIFAPFTYRTLIFLGAGVVVFFVLPWIVPRFFKRYGNRPSELEAKFLMACLFGMGALATWADSEAVLPAYLIGMVLAGTVGKDHALVRRLRTLTFGLLTPFYFIRAGSLVPDIPEEVETEAIMENSQRHYEEIQEPLKAIAEAQGVSVHFVVAIGHHAVKITTYAEENAIDLIVMGHRGKTFFERWLIGSVAKKVMSYAPCSVLVVR